MTVFAMVMVFLLGVGVGSAAIVLSLPKKVGTIRLVSSQPGELPSMYVELNRPVEDMLKYNKVLMDISHK